jgi:predicted RNA-binding protein YlqC (UPF0109 family)
MSPAPTPMARWAELVRFMIASGVTHADAVTVTPYEERDGLLLVVEVDERDRGQVIGKAGRNLQALELALRLSADLGAPPRIELQG